ncbi:hypothetical protein STCU_10374 [Strigomonas culicis]|uniref:Uncharacterized protein n=1 Tax=Strigomonas culicis TaxID=28005 RepID=S9UTD9_9TRYP|nr:hypothetical protein STCU_10374 [Strigomonas culicis]|eukprot:EPY17831.1 hypothetical protein STCU_10374 [Strigomonas culicis]
MRERVREKERHFVCLLRYLMYDQTDMSGRKSCSVSGRRGEKRRRKGRERIADTFMYYVLVHEKVAEGSFCVL